MVIIYPKANHEKRRTTAAQAAMGQQEVPSPESLGENFKTML
jgi:hypothetical protein